MIELAATGIITVSSMVLFAYWLRCAWLLMRGEYPPPAAAEAVQKEPPVFQSR